MAEKKFGQLSAGQEFFWQGGKWLKTSPLLARPEDSEQARIIPRSAMVQSGETETTPDNDAGAAEIREILRQLEQECLSNIELLQLNPDQLQTLREIVAKAVQNARNKAAFSGQAC